MKKGYSSTGSPFFIVSSHQQKTSAFAHGCMRQGRMILADSHPNILGGNRRLLEDEVEAILMVTGEISLNHALENFSPDEVVAGDQVIGDGALLIADNCLPIANYEQGGELWNVMQ